MSNSAAKKMRLIRITEDEAYLIFRLLYFFMNDDALNCNHLEDLVLPKNKRKRKESIAMLERVKGIL